MSRVGTPSVMHTISAMPASAASMIASAAKAAGTKITEVFAFVRGNRIGHGIEHRDLTREGILLRPLVRQSALAGGDARNDVRAVLQHLLRVEGPLTAGDALHHQPRRLVDENAHGSWV